MEFIKEEVMDTFSKEICPIELVEITNYREFESFVAVNYIDEGYPMYANFTKNKRGKLVVISQGEG